MSDNVRETLHRWVEEAVELRYGAGHDPEGPLPADPGEHPEDVIHTMNRVRQRADRVEELLTRTRRVKGQLWRKQTEAAFEAEHKRDQALQRGAATRTIEFVSAAERAADASLASIDEKRAAHQAKMLLDAAQEAFDVIDQCRWGLSAYRQDLRAQLHGMQVIRSIENTGRA